MGCRVGVAGFAIPSLCGGRVYFANFENGATASTFPEAPRAGSYLNTLRANIRRVPLWGNLFSNTWLCAYLHDVPIQQMIIVGWGGCP